MLGRTPFQTLVACSILLPGCSLQKRLKALQDYENVQGDDELAVIKDFRGVGTAAKPTTPTADTAAKPASPQIQKS